MSLLERAKARILADRTGPAAAAPELVTDLTGATHRPLVLSKEMRDRMAARIHVAVPTNPDAILDLDRRRRIEGLPVDVLLVLEGLALLAEQGNHVAAHLLVEERQKLGIDRPLTSYRKE